MYLFLQTCICYVGVGVSTYVYLGMCLCICIFGSVYVCIGGLFVCMSWWVYVHCFGCICEYVPVAYAYRGPKLVSCVLVTVIFWEDTTWSKQLLQKQAHS